MRIPKIPRLKRLLLNFGERRNNPFEYKHRSHFRSQCLFILSIGVNIFCYWNPMTNTVHCVPLFYLSPRMWDQPIFYYQAILAKWKMRINPLTYGKYTCCISIRLSILGIRSKMVFLNVKCAQNRQIFYIQSTHSEQCLIIAHTVKWLFTVHCVVWNQLRNDFCRKL